VEPGACLSGAAVVWYVTECSDKGVGSLSFSASGGREGEKALFVVLVKSKAQTASFVSVATIHFPPFSTLFFLLALPFDFQSFFFLSRSSRRPGRRSKRKKGVGLVKESSWDWYLQLEREVAGTGQQEKERGKERRRKRSRTKEFARFLLGDDLTVATTHPTGVIR